MSDRIGVGVIGCGSVAWISHLPWYWENSNVDLIAVCDPDEEKAQQAADRWGAAHCYQDVQDMLGRSDIDAVSICTPPNLHCEHAIQAAQAGVHILCEKPMAPTIEECGRMIEAAKEHQVKLMVGFMKRFNPAFEEIKRIIDEGLIGDVFHLDVHWEFATNVAARMKRGGGAHWRMMDKAVKGGVFQDHGSHYIDLFRWWTGSEVVQVTGETLRISPLVANEDHSVGMLKMKSGALGLIETSRNAHSISPLRHEEGPGLLEYGYIYGTEGGVVFDALPWDAKELPFVKVYTNGGKEDGYRGWRSPRLPRVVRQPGGVMSPNENDTYWFKREIDHFVDCILNDVEPLVTGDDGRKAIEVINAVYLSALGGEKVKLPLEASPDLEALFDGLESWQSRSDS
ncbi:MAG: Gfo/Idh/MocA family oxidoreductase [Candidatus Latescibacteria bacterium]|nr:Gfo/Idh/MocA family oxidoreductase [Candidatus Latescibacterota bacterium]